MYLKKWIKCNDQPQQNVSHIQTEHLNRGIALNISFDQISESGDGIRYVQNGKKANWLCCSLIQMMQKLPEFAHFLNERIIKCKMIKRTNSSSKKNLKNLPSSNRLAQLYFVSVCRSECTNNILANSIERRNQTGQSPVPDHGQ